MQSCLHANLGTDLPRLWVHSTQVKHSSQKVSSGPASSLLGAGQLRVPLGISPLSCYVLLAFQTHYNLLLAVGWSVWTLTWLLCVPQYIHHTELFSCRTGILTLGHLGSWLRQRERILLGSSLSSSSVITAAHEALGQVNFCCSLFETALAEWECYNKVPLCEYIM